MSSPLSKVPAPLKTPVALAIGLVPAAVEQAKKLPMLAVQIPVIALSKGLDVLDKASQTYGGLAQRGESVVKGAEAPRLSVVTDRVAPLVDKVVDVAEDAAEKVDGVTDRISGKKAPLVKATPPAEQAKSAPTPAAPTGGVTHHDTAASADVVEIVDAVAAFSSAPEVTDRADLPLPDFDHLTLGSLRGRIRSLAVPQLVQLRDYEKGHADRLPVVTLLDNRIAKLATDAGATPSEGGPAPVLPSAPEATGPSAKPSKKASTPRTKVRNS